MWRFARFYKKMREARSDEAFFIGDDLPVDCRQWRGAPDDGTRMRKCREATPVTHISSLISFFVRILR